MLTENFVKSQALVATVDPSAEKAPELSDSQ